MKRTKSIVLVLVMSLLLSVTAYATEPNTDETVQSNEIKNSIDYPDMVPNNAEQLEPIEDEIDNYENETVDPEQALSDIEQAVLSSATEKTKEEVSE